MSVIKVDTILNKDGTGGPILSGLTTVGILTGALSVGTTSVYAETVNAGIVTNVVSIGATNVWVSGSIAGSLTGTATGLSGSPNITVTNLTATGDVSIAGTLTYNDVTNIDSVGIITAQSGMVVSGVTTFLGSQYGINALGVSTFTDNVKLGDNDQLQFGDAASGDLQIYHDGSNSYIDEAGTGNLYVRSTAGNIYFKQNTTEDAIIINQNGSVQIYNDNSIKLTTTGGGIDVTGTATVDGIVNSGVSTFNGSIKHGDNVKALFGTSDDLEIFHDGTDSVVKDAGAGVLSLRGSGIYIQNETGSKSAATFVPDNQAQLMYNGSVKLATTTDGIDITGIATVDGIVNSGTSTLTGNVTVGSATTSNSLYVVGNSASNVVGLTSQTSSFALDFSLGNNFSFVIGGNITLNNPTGVTTGQSGIIEITQDDTGSRTMGFQSHWNFADGNAPTITAGAGTTSVLAYFVKDTDMIITTSILALG